MRREDFRNVNCEVMKNTQIHCTRDPKLVAAIKDSIDSQYVVWHNDNIDQKVASDVNTKYVVSGKRSLHAAKGYVGKYKKIAVLNFANSHSPGGAPYSAGAQEESICRCSTLYPCLKAFEDKFYKIHQEMFERHEIDYMGNDDLIYTPDVVVFKSDLLTDTRYPEIVAEDEWYKVDIITSAAPELMRMRYAPHNYEDIIASRIKKILDVAKMNGVEVLILGAWGCGAFKNPTAVVARVFRRLLRNYDFKVVEFALSSSDTEYITKESDFAKEFLIDECREDICQCIAASADITQIKEQIIKLLKETGRENIDKAIAWMENNGFFSAPASVVHHNNFVGGLAKHSLDVCQEALKLNSDYKLPLSSVVLCSLLHDICKSDQYRMDGNRPAREEKMIQKGHGRRSMFIAKRGCSVPLNYDEEMAIWWHMGEHEVSLTDFERMYKDSLTIPLCNLIREADKKAAL